MTEEDQDTTPMDAPEPVEDSLVAQRLLTARSAPEAGLRAGLRRRLVALGPPPARPPRLWRTVALLGSCGLLLLAIGALSAAGVGPLAP
jgi:hypothetical protein